MCIRRLNPTDEAAWRNLWLGYQDFYKVRLPGKVTQNTWQRFFDDEELMGALGAFDGDCLQGFVHYVYQDSTWSVERTCYLQDLYVQSSARNQGIGRQLIGAVYGIAASAGIGRVYWLTQENNLAARALYDELAECPGFVMYEHRTKYSDRRA